MANITKIAGIREVVRNLMRQDERFARGISTGLKKAGLYLQRTSQQQVPREFSNLFRSAQTRATGMGYQTKVQVGYKSAYALFVHEKVEMKLKGLPRGVNLNVYEVTAKGRLVEKETKRFAPNSARNGHIGNYWDPAGKGKAKFLEDPIRTEKDQMKKIVIDSAIRSKL